MHLTPEEMLTVFVSDQLQTASVTIYFHLEKY